MNSLYQYFKFRDINKNTIESLLKGTIFFSIPEKLNDPFDCNLDIENAIKNATRDLGEDNSIKQIDKNILNIFYRKIRNIGICSFSLELKNSLLWSHYSNNHKGLSILYEFLL